MELTIAGTEIEHVRNSLTRIMDAVCAEKSIQKAYAMQIQIYLDSIIRLAAWIKEDIEKRIE